VVELLRLADKTLSIDQEKPNQCIEEGDLLHGRGQAANDRPLGGQRWFVGLPLSFGGIRPRLAARSRPALRQHDIARAREHGIG
jgi:hypothetical protein